MKQKFISVPTPIMEDLINGALISTDVMVYMFLSAKCSHGKRVFMSRQKMVSGLGGMSVSRLSSSLSRLSKAGHLERIKLNGSTSTRLLTFVKDRYNIYVKGKNIYEDFSKV
tara:strand:+ start:78 stop:413 length:336 start_codon:yes stop_codon:yes gene_type:complete